MPSLNLSLILAAAFALAPLNGVMAVPRNVFTFDNPGINCDGSSSCGLGANAMYTILEQVNKIPIGTTYTSGQLIACDIGSGGGSVCAMLGHNTPSFTVGGPDNGQPNSAGAVIKDLLWKGCQGCGTAPIVRTGNDLSKGSISVNWVEHGCKSKDKEPCPIEDFKKSASD